MSDLISREEVLNLIDTAFENGAFDGRYAYENLIDAVQNLIHPLETDLISRQAAIDAVGYYCLHSGDKLLFADKPLKDLPSVEPEQSQCSWYGEDGRCHFAEQEMDECDDCISRTALQEWIKDKTFGDIVVASEHNFDCLPSVEPERKVGKWIDEGWYAEGHSEHAYRCSECDKHYIGYVGEYKHCPNCGADMREVQDGSCE